MRCQVGLVLLLTLVTAACSDESPRRRRSRTAHDERASSAPSQPQAPSYDSSQVDPPPQPQQVASTPASSGAAPSAPAPPGGGLLPGCVLQCNAAQIKNRVPSSEETRVAQAIASELAILHGCKHGQPAGGITMRFDSSGTLTQLGIDPDEGADPGCLDSVRGRHPAVSYPGPTTLRCAERCR